MSTRATKLVIQMSGAPGSGKSTLARLLRPRLNGIIIDHDVLRSSLLSSSTIAFDNAAKQAYRLQWDLADDLMQQGIETVIIDSTCNYNEVLERGSALASKHGYSYWYVECKANDIELLDQRLRGRPAMVSQRGAIDCPPAAAQGNGSRVGEDARALFMKWMDSPCRPEGHGVIIVDSMVDAESLCNNVLKHISAG